jgi:transcriptional regulator with XRE-family HTH domain
MVAMATRERIRIVGLQRGERLRRQIGELLEQGRLKLGLSQEEVARAVGTSRDRYRRWERAKGESIGLEDAAIALRCVGLDLTLSAYPSGGPLRDQPHARLIGRFLRDLPADLHRELESPIPYARDLRAWDVLVVVAGARIGVAAETRLRDGQALLRREQQKARDGNVDRLLLVLSDTAWNRRAVRDAGSWMREAFPLDGRTVRAALRARRDPGGNGLLFA